MDMSILITYNKKYKHEYISIREKEQNFGFLTKI